MKPIKLFIIILSFSNSSFCQKINTNVIAGISFPSFYVFNTNSSKNKIGINIGLLSNFLISKKIKIETGLIYSNEKANIQRSFQYPFDPHPWDVPLVKENINLNKIKLPISVMLESKKNKLFSTNVGFYFETYFSNSRNGYSERGGSYSDYFRLKTQKNSPLGFGAFLAVNKFFEIKNRIFFVQLCLDKNFNQFVYPTNSEIEKEVDQYKLRLFKLSFNVGIKL